MTEEYAQSPKENPTSYRSQADEDTDEISIGDLLYRLWRYRARILVYSLAAAFMILAIAGYLYFSQEKQTSTQIEFKVQFQGADKGEYPNGMKFSSNDILSTPVLDKVYRENDLQRFLKYSDFCSALAVYQTNDELRMLEYEYAQKLSERGLSVESRERLEAEFREKKKNLMVPTYTLLFAQNSRLESLPKDLTAKVLNDTLQTWAEYAERVRGANEYQMEIVSRNILAKDSLEFEDYLISADMLRQVIHRIEDDIEKLAELPGAKVISVGDKGTSLSDLKYRIGDLDQFKLGQVFGLIEQYGVSNQANMTLAYLTNRRFTLGLKTEEAAANMKVYENSLSQYVSNSIGVEMPVTGGSPGSPNASPQFDASFFDRLVQMGERNSDAEFRQDITEKIMEAGLKRANLQYETQYYQNLYDKFKAFERQQTVKDGTEEDRPLQSVVEHIKKTQLQVFEGVMQAIDDVNAIYKALSEHNLNPESVLYSITSPISTYVEKPLRAKKVLLYALLALAVAEGAILVGVLLAGGLRKESRD